jgi:hypothetical protein
MVVILWFVPICVHYGGYDSHIGIKLQDIITEEVVAYDDVFAHPDKPGYLLFMKKGQVNSVVEFKEHIGIELLREPF